MRNCLVLILITVFSFLVLTVGINKPFNGHHDWNNRFFGQIANSYLNSGIFQLGFGQLINQSIPQSHNFYTHHPPLFPLILSVFIGVFGNFPWVVRLAPISFSVGTAVILYLLLRRFFNPVAAIFAIAFYLATPMYLYFGKMANHEVFTLFFIVLTLYGFLRWRESGKPRDLIFTLASLFLGQWTGWPAYYLAGFLFLWSKNTSFLILSLINFASYLLRVYSLTGSVVGGGLREVFFLGWVLLNCPTCTKSTQIYNF